MPEYPIFNRRSQSSVPTGRPEPALCALPVQETSLLILNPRTEILGKDLTV